MDTACSSSLVAAHLAAAGLAAGESAAALAAGVNLILVPQVCYRVFNRPHACTSHGVQGKAAESFGHCKPPMLVAACMSKSASLQNLRLTLLLAMSSVFSTDHVWLYPRTSYYLYCRIRRRPCTWRGWARCPLWGAAAHLTPRQTGTGAARAASLFCCGSLAQRMRAHACWQCYAVRDRFSHEAPVNLTIGAHCSDMLATCLPHTQDTTCLTSVTTSQCHDSA